MSDKDIIKKAFDKAEKNGYKISLSAPIDKVIEYGIYYKFIFNHDFAKAFFTEKFTGEKLLVKSDFYLDCLSEMVKEKEPIKYLEKFL